MRHASPCLSHAVFNMVFSFFFRSTASASVFFGNSVPDVQAGTQFPIRELPRPVEAESYEASCYTARIEGLPSYKGQTHLSGNSVPAFRITRNTYHEKRRTNISNPESNISCSAGSPCHSSFFISYHGQG